MFDSVGASGSSSTSLLLTAAGSADASSNQLSLAAAPSSVGIKIFSRCLAQQRNSVTAKEASRENSQLGVR